MKILLVEDEKALSNALVTILKHNKYSADAVYDGEDALIYIEFGSYDCVILDIMLPKLDGIRVLKTIREKNNNIPVLLLTSKAEIEDKVTGLDMGADDYLTKPFNTQELLARIRALTRRKTELSDNILKYGDLQLNRSSFELMTTKHKMMLTSKEFQIMEIFIINVNQMVPLDLIMEKVWGYDSEVENNVIWTYISYLRKKLKLIGSTVDIKSVRNIGYTLEIKK